MTSYDKQTSNTRMAQMRPGDIIVIASNRQLLSPDKSSSASVSAWGGGVFDVEMVKMSW